MNPRIAIFCEYYAPHIGGVETRVGGLAAGLAAHGCAVTIHTVGYRADLAQHETHGNITVLRYPAPGYGRGSRRFRRSPTASTGFALWCRQRAGSAYDLLIYEEFPLLHALLAPRHIRKRSVMDWCEYRSSAAFHLIQTILPRMFRWNAATNHAVAGKIAQTSGCTVSCLPSGICRSEFRQSTQRTGIVYLGRLFRHKNLPLVISSFEELCRRGYQGGLTIVGNGPENETVHALARQSPWSTRIELAGEVGDDEKIRILSRAELMFLLSEREGFPVSMAEAMASGLPIVTIDAPDNGGVDVVSEYRAGIAAAPREKEVADAAEVILRDWTTWSQNCLSAARSLDWEQLLPGFMAQFGIRLEDNAAEQQRGREA
jgi:glycosyltransferase involved in cell wall biosynthesis